MINWHRIFGAVLCDFFSDSTYSVELEKDLSLKQQFLDVVVVRKTDSDAPSNKMLELPDGFDNLHEHNLITYKSHQETLNRYALFELYGHFINYMKQAENQGISVDFNNCQLYAVSARMPEKLLTQGDFRPIQAGVYEYDVLEYTLRIIVTSGMDNLARNAVWQLFSGNQTQFAHGVRHYDIHQIPHNELMRQVFRYYQLEELFPMAYSLEEFIKDLHEETLNSLTEQDRIKAMQRLPIEKRLEGIPTTERLEGIPMAERLEGISTAELLEVISAEEFLKGLEPEDIKKMLAELNKKLS